jgi:hypothetical protein
MSTGAAGMRFIAAASTAARVLDPFGMRGKTFRHRDVCRLRPQACSKYLRRSQSVTTASNFRCSVLKKCR